MQIFLGILKFIAFLLTFLLVKFASVYCLNLPVFAVAVFLESILVFIVTGVFLLAFDSSKRTFTEKLITTLELAGGFIAVFFILAIVKNAVNRTMFSAIANFVLAGLMGSLLLIRDKFLYDNMPKRNIDCLFCRNEAAAQYHILVAGRFCLGRYGRNVVLADCGICMRNICHKINSFKHIIVRLY